MPRAHAYRMRDNEIYDRLGNRLGYLRDDTIYDAVNRRLGYVRDVNIFDSGNRRIAYVREQDVYSALNNRIGRVEEIAAWVQGAPADIHGVAIALLIAGKGEGQGPAR